MNNKTVVVISIYIVNKSKAVLQILLGSVIFIRLMPDHCLALSISKSSAIETCLFVTWISQSCCMDLPKSLYIELFMLLLGFAEVVSSVRSSNCHSELLLTQHHHHHPTFSD